MNGILAGASLDQSIKQLPARHTIGAVAYSVYSRASDLGPGIAWYAIIGIGAALLTFVAGVAVYLHGSRLSAALPIYMAALLSILHPLVTTQAAPILHSQRRFSSDGVALAAVFGRFARWQTLRGALQVLTFCALLWAIAVYP